MSMHVDIGQALEAFVRREVASGRYGSESEVVREALALLAEEARLKAAELADMRRKIEAGWASAEQGDLLAGDDVFDELERELAASSRRP
ncbi:MAG: type II toxin-antitoxin system ParD family antitoxin [Sandaracinaceae bacterium]|nr:type II toxin-antitoxin system ParD family antitoxin [Sandaracinaceae bacterium]